MGAAMEASPATSPMREKSPECQRSEPGTPQDTAVIEDCSYKDDAATPHESPHPDEREHGEATAAEASPAVVASKSDVHPLAQSTSVAPGAIASLLVIGLDDSPTERAPPQD